MAKALSCCTGKSLRWVALCYLRCKRSSATSLHPNKFKEVS